MWWGLLQICWICLMLNWKCRGASADHTETPTLNLEAEMNGKIQPSTLEIFSSIIDENPVEFSGDSEPTTDFDNREYFNEKFKNILTNDDNLFMHNFEDIPDNIRNIEDTSGTRTINKLSEATKEGFTARKGTTRNLNGSKSHHTTKRSIELTATSPEIPKEKSLNPKYPSLFFDSDRTVGNLAAKLKPLTDGSDKDGLEKDGNRMDWLGGETAKELLDIEDIPSESQVVLPGNIVTKLSVQETVDGQTIQRKPTEEELHLAQSELEADNDIMGREHKFLSQNKETNNSSHSDVIVDVDTILRPDPGFADDDTDFISSDWSDDDDDDDDVVDMESILKDDMDVFKRFHVDNGHSNIMEMEQPSGDYRTIFHTESKNFSNVKEERIEISETEGDSFDDDNDHFPSLYSSNVSETEFSSTNNTNTITEDSTTTITNLNEAFASTFTPSSADSTTTKLISADNAATELSKYSETETTISNTPTVNSIKSEASTVPTVATEPAGEILAENGISIKDFNDIVSLTENSYHEMNVPNNETIIVTRISVQETVDGQTIERKPTEEELHLVESTTAEIIKTSTTPLIHVQTDKTSELTTQLSNEGIPTTESTYETTIYAKNKATTVSVGSVDEFNTSVGPATIPVDTSTVDLPIKSNGETSNNLQETTEHEYSSTEETTLKALPTENTSTDAEDINDVLNRFINKVDEIEKYETTSSEVEHDYSSTQENTLKTLATENSSTDAEDINDVLNRFINKVDDEIEKYETTSSEVEHEYSSTEETTLKILPTENTSTDAEDINDLLNRFISKVDEIEKYETTPSEVEHDYSSTEETTLKILPTENTPTDAEDINDIFNRFINKVDEIEKSETTSSDVEHEYSSTEKNTLKTLPTENTDSIQSPTDGKDILNRFLNKIDEIEEHEITPSEVESMLNSKIEEYEDDDYDSKEHSVVNNDTKESGYIFGEPRDVKEVDNNLSLDEDDKNETIGQRVQLVPLLKATILNGSAEFNVKVSKKDDTFYVPSSASIKEYDNIINITWRITEDMNNSVAMRIFEKDQFYMIKEIITHLFTGNKFKTQQKPVAFHPDPVMDDTMPGRTRIVMMKDGTYITFSNVEFLKKVAPTDDSREISEATRRDPKLWHFEVASICIVTVIIVVLVLYVIAIKTRAKVTLREKDELPQVTHC